MKISDSKLSNVKTPKVLILISHSLGELDVVLPILLENSNRNKIQIEIIFTVKDIYNKFFLNKFYKFIILKLDIKVNHIYIHNKFDFRYNNFILRKINKAISISRSILNLLLLIFKFIKSDFLMHEFTQIDLSLPYIYFINKYFKKRVYTYCHGVSLHPYSRGNKKKNATFSQYLLFDEMNKSNADSMGYSNIKFIGLPKFLPKWNETIINYANLINTEYNYEYAVVFTRSISPYYMTKSQYKNLFIDTYEAIRNIYGNLKIIIKLHPRENTSFVNDIINSHKLNNIIISHENASVLLCKSLFAISFWTSCAIDSLSLNIPYIEYYKVTKAFLEVEPSGSIFKKVGFISSDNTESLNKEIMNIKNCTFSYPREMTDRFNNNNIKFINSMFNNRYKINI